MTTINIPFELQPLTLIELVKARPCLWDKTILIYKDKVLKRRAWTEIYTILKEDYAELSLQHRQAVADYITSRWTNLRDAFVRSQKKKPGQPNGKPYIYSENMSFLKKILVDKDEDSSFSDSVTLKCETYLDSQYQVDESQQDDVALTLTNDEVTEDNSSGYKRKYQPDDENEALQSDIYNKSMYQIDEDEAFFLSLISSVRGMIEEEKLEFRMGVLQLIQKIKGRRNFQTAS